METFYIDKYEIEINLTPETKAGELVECSIKLRDMNTCPESDKELSHYVWCYRVVRFVDDTGLDLARRVFTYYKMGTEPNRKFAVEALMTAAQIREAISSNETSFQEAMKWLREIMDAPTRDLESLLAQLNLCSEIAQRRAVLEYELQKAIQAGR